MGAVKERAIELIDELVSLHLAPEKYVQHCLDVCPRCGSYDVETEGEALEGCTYVVEGWCPDCGAEWRDEFAWYGRTITKEGEV